LNTYIHIRVETPSRVKSWPKPIIYQLEISIAHRPVLGNIIYELFTS